MRLLDRYLLKELLLPFGCCLGGFILLSVGSDWFQDPGKLQEARLTAPDILEYYVVRAPEFILFILPVALLLSLLYTLTNHARCNEITAIRAAGVSLWRLSLPYFLVAALCAGAVYWLDEHHMPDVDERTSEILSRRVKTAQAHQGRDWVQNLGFRNARDGRRWQIGSFNKHSAELINPRVDWLDGDGARQWIIATRAVPTNGGWLFFGVSEYIETNSTHLPGPQHEALFKTFTETPDEIRSEIRISQRLSLLRPRAVDVPVSDIRDYLRLHPVLTETDRNKLLTMLHSRLAEPFKCVVVVLLAIPFGAASGRRNPVVGVAGSIVIFIAYYMAVMLTQALGAGGTLPPWLAGWMPNLLFGSTGLWLTARVR
jgi:lipopolysaccharide export system permease protein